jgi:alanyl-tRNA synthetase
LRAEEGRFKTTLDRGLKLLDDELADLPEGAALPGASAFKLYDTYGFPLDLTQDALRERRRAVDVEGFDAAMAEQKRMARAAWAGSGEAADEAIWFDLAEAQGPTEFLGYDSERAEARLLEIVKDGRLAETASAGEEVSLVFNQTPFYGESGGQIGDAGLIRFEGGRVDIRDVRKKAGVFVHLGTVGEGTIAAAANAVLEVDHARRSAIRANHSATHLLHEALRRALGDHVAQRGSLVAADRLRFDFAHPKAMSPDEIAGVEAVVNDYIRQDSPVETRIMTPEDAQALGARALFGEKYGDEVRVVSMGQSPGSGVGVTGDTYSLELCGGTHVARTGEIGLFKLVSEGASAGGIRRVEALTGAAAIEHVAAQEAALQEAAALLKARPADLAERVRALLDERKAQTQEIADLRRKLALAGDGRAAAAGPETVAGIPFLAQTLTGVSGKDLRRIIDEHKARLGTGVILLVADTGGRAAVAAGVTGDLTDRISAVDLVRAAAEALGGKGGGGRPDMAQAGGNDPSKAGDAVAAARALLEA